MVDKYFCYKFASEFIKKHRPNIIGMKYISLPEEKTRKLSFYLAMEEYVAYHIDEQDSFFMWQVEPSVIFGRNQLIENEVNIPFCRERSTVSFIVNMTFSDILTPSFAQFRYCVFNAV